jgi:hypothetical protein
MQILPLRVMRLRRTLPLIRRIIGQDYDFSALDENLWAFRGFHESPDDPHYRARRWVKARIGGITPSDVLDLPVWELAFMMNVAMELEDPILDYSRQNGEGFRVLLPSLARFMGKNQDEAAFAAAHHLPWCESPWCAEERRHANTFARIIERLTNTSPDRQNPNRPMIATPEEEDAVRLIISREAAEWNSSSTYVVMAAHATGDLHDLIRNVARDEIKHLAILSAADRYLFGPRPWRRFVQLVRNSMDEFRGQKHKRSGGQLLGTSWITATEVIVAHLLAEARMRKWLRSLPLLTLSGIFETPAHLPDPATLIAPVDRRARLDEALENGRERRAKLLRWPSAARRRAENDQACERVHEAALDALVAKALGHFAGAEVPGSRGEKVLRRKIRRVAARRLRGCLQHLLRDYQIRNNRYVRAGER